MTYRQSSSVIVAAWNVVANDNTNDAGRDNRKSAAAGAKDGQFSSGFVTRESLHEGQWPHPPSPSRASSPPTPPVYLFPCLLRETLPSLPHEPSTANASHGSPRDSRLCMDLIRQSNQLSPKSDGNRLLGPFFFFFSFSFYLARVHSVPDPEKMFRGPKGQWKAESTGWMRGRRTRIARMARGNADGIVINARISSELLFRIVKKFQGRVNEIEISPWDSIINKNWSR